MLFCIVLTLGGVCLDISFSTDCIKKRLVVHSADCRVVRDGGESGGEWKYHYQLPYHSYHVLRYPFVFELGFVSSGDNHFKIMVCACAYGQWRRWTTHVWSTKTGGGVVVLSVVLSVEWWVVVEFPNPNDFPSKRNRRRKRKVRWREGSHHHHPHIQGGERERVRD